ncbi:MAG: branched-chain amino acid ABC transporter permease [Burkholderiales bacterium]
MNAMTSFTVERSTRVSQISAVIAVLGLAVLISLPYWGQTGTMRLIAEMAYYLALAQLWNLLAGYAGLVSVGQQVYIGIGGYFLFAASDWYNVHPLLAILISGAAAAIISLPMAFIVFRLRGAYFAVGTWVVAEIFNLFIAQIPKLGGGSGYSLTPEIVRSVAPDRAGREMLMYWMALAICVAIIAFIYLLLRSRHGLALTAIRDSEAASESLGVDTYRTKLMIYVFTALCTGLLGGFIFLQKLRISPESAFSINDWTVVVIFMVVIGGIGTMEGPILGLLIYFAMRELLADYGSWYLILLGVVAVVVMLTAREGLWGLIAKRYDLHPFPVRRRLIKGARLD